ncbi:PREDICTED: GATA transcription factor 4-like isoform X2 [Camelina sativa]|uniref:GATA transcription factor n=1 Tax=Camelina sativa TaxID=90675 RepID=A0ABM0SMU9_CAMSA|nr:PREDICTED: GATA transcription factor 4-like isoform X2 [Camelina sativa]
MDVYGMSSPDLLRIDDLLDFSNDEIFSSSSSTVTSSAASSVASENPFNFPSSAHTSPPLLTDFTHDLCVPSDDAAHLEWLSRFVDDSFSDFPTNPLTMSVRPEVSFTGKPRSRRSRAPAPSVAGTWAPMPESELCHGSVPKPKHKKEYNGESVTADVGGGGGGGARRCTHCASEKTPQWRTGPLGPKTLCNACGVRYKSGRLVPEYRPASSPTFVLTQHSNSHRKVMELRRQKEQQESCVSIPAFQPR